MVPGTVIGIIGPTGVGKTAVAMDVAVALGTRVISCDSMQVYRGFPVLTNQPTATEMQIVRHELVGIVDPGQRFSAGEYAARARPLVEADLAQHGWALVVGGTGLYLRAALAPLSMAPAADPAVRRALEDRVAAEGSASLHAELSRRDPAAAAAIGPHNSRRLIRALEVIAVTGSPWSGRDDLWEPTYYRPTLLVALTLERAELYRRIDARAARIVTEGAVDEVRRYLRSASSTGAGGAADEAASAAAPAGIESAIGFREIRRHLEGEQSLEETISQVAAATRRYARRQSTWLRKLRDAIIIDVRDREPSAVADEILALALSGEHTKEPRQP